MDRDKRSRGREKTREGIARSVDAINKAQDSEYSSDNVFSDHPKSPSVRLRSERTISSAPVKGSRRQRKELNVSEDSENETEGDSSQQIDFEYESASNNKKIEVRDTVRNVEDFTINAASNNKNYGSESPVHEFSTREKKKKSKKQRKEKNRIVLDFNRTDDDDESNDEDARFSERDLSRSRPKNIRHDISAHKKRRKRHRSKGITSSKTESREKELPITEILRKAQENPKPRYEEPLPLAELTTDKIYVQGRNGFSAVKISNQRSNGIFNHRLSNEKGPPLYPIKVAIVAQKIWGSTGLIHQGLLAGMALMHFLLMQAFFRFSLDFLRDYSAISELYTNIFSYLVTMCVISVLDRFDLGQLDVEHFREIYAEHSRSFLAVPLYIATFLLHQAGLFVDDNISLLGYKRNATDFGNNFASIVAEDDLAAWQKVTFAKDSLAVLAWLFIALGPRDDMLFTHLKSMEKYVEIAENSA